MLSKEEFHARLVKSGMKFVENSPTPGVRIGKKFYGVGEVPYPSGLLANTVIDFDEMEARYKDSAQGSHIFDSPTSESGVEKCR